MAAKLMKRISQLDGVRGIAILLVLVWHYFNCQIVYQPKSFLSYCRDATSLTWSGVDLFFVLSGFLIGGILLDQRNTSNYFRVFYLRRVCRILPLYFLVLAVFVALSATSIATSPSFQWLFHDPCPLWSYATFTQNICMGARGGWGPFWLNITWSLAVEEQFYLFVPLLIYFLRRRILFPVLILLILAAPILRCVFPGFGAFVNTPWRADSLLSGVALAVLVRWDPFVVAVQQHRRLLLSLFVAMLARTGVMTTLPLTPAQAFNHPWLAALSNLSPHGAINHSWLAALYSLFILIAFAGTEGRMGSLLRSSVLVWFGQISYGIYLFHEPVSGLLHGALRHSEPQIRTLSDAGITILALCITIFLAAISYRFFEKPILRFGHRFQYCRRPRTALSLEPVPNTV
jgi:peptidoglycan/LPS O-acetylase OafA/YrhL